MRYGELLSTARKNRKRSINWLARKLGVNAAWVRQIELGLVKPPADMSLVLRAADVLGAQPHEMICAAVAEAGGAKLAAPATDSARIQALAVLVARWPDATSQRIAEILRAAW